MSTMRAVQVVGYHQNLEMKEVPAPTPIGPFDVVVKIGGAGVCRTDLHILEGQWAEKSGVELPYTIGHENAGWVDAVGSAVANVSEGDKVIVHPLITCGLCRACRSGDDVHCEASAFPGIDTNGGYADYLKTSARSVVRIDDSLEPSDVAALADAGLTAYHAAAKAARRLTPRDKCVIIGAGGLGHIGIQVLKALAAAELIVVDRNAEALKLAESIGADHGVLADGSQVDKVLELTGGNGAEAVVDFVGEGGATSEGVRMLHRAGDYHVVGYGENINVPTIDIVSTEINFIGNLVGSYNDLCDLMALAARAEIPARRFPIRHRRPGLGPCPRPGHPHSVKGRSAHDFYSRQVRNQTGMDRALAGPGSRLHRGHARRGRKPLVRLVTQPGRPGGIRSGGRLPGCGGRRRTCQQRAFQEGHHRNAPGAGLHAEDHQSDHRRHRVVRDGRDESRVATRLLDGETVSGSCRSTRPRGMRVPRASTSELSAAHVRSMSGRISARSLR